jgi:hypothetical protein
MVRMGRMDHTVRTGHMGRTVPTVGQEVRAVMV